MYKVFINDLLIEFNSLSNYNDSEYEIIRLENQQLTEDIFNKIKGEKLTKDLLVICVSPEEVFKSFTKHFKILKAAGGIVSNAEGEFLLINRLGKWDFPKGKIEKGESAEISAIREVEEETSVKNLIITKQLETTYHIYRLKGQFILKPTYWFEMKTDALTKLIPQTEEDITEVIWEAKAKLIQKLKTNSYRSLSETFLNYILNF